MRFCGGFLCREQVYCPKKGHKTGSTAGESVDSALLAIDHTDGDPALQTGLPERLESLNRGSSRGDDVLDEADALAWFEDPFQAIRSPVLLRLVADDQERQARGERGCRGEDDCTQLRARDAHGFRLVLRNRGGDVVTEHGQQVGPGLEAVLVQVVARAAARAQEEVALEVGVLAKRRSELVALHDRAERIASRARGISREASGESPAMEIIDPSAK